MHVLLTDRLACPRCGPDFGLILLAERMEDRRVLEGRLGCPNCRDHFPVIDGFGDLRAPPRTPFADEPPPGEDSSPGPPANTSREQNTRPRERSTGPPSASPPHDETLKLAALLGVAEGPGHLALLGPVVRQAEALAELLDGLEVVAVGAGLRRRPERAGVSRLAARPGLPFYSGSLRGVALAGSSRQEPGAVGVAPDPWLGEAARVTAPTGRVVVLDAAPGTREALEDAGLTVVLDDAGAVVATRERGPGGRSGGGVALPVFPGPPGRKP